MDINDFPLNANPADSDLMLIWDSATGSTKQISLSLLKAYFQDGEPPPPDNQIILNHLSDGDANGVFYYLATNRLTQAWANPHLSSTVLVSLSAILNAQHNNPQFVVDREISEYIATANIPESSIAVELLGGANLVINAYSIRGRNSGGENPRSWKLQALSDNSNWVDIDIKPNSPLGGNQWLTVAIAGQTAAYSHFRILQTGTNTSGSYYLCIGELELYGTLFFS